MKDKYYKAYQQQIEKIKTLDVSPKEKRKLAADAKNEILSQYKASYIKEMEVATRRELSETQNQKAHETNVGAGIEVKEKITNDSLEEQDPIENILNKLEEREERGEVGIDLDTPTEFMNPNELFATMNLDELFASIDSDDEFMDEEDGDAVSSDELFMDSETLFASFLDDIEDEIEYDEISHEFELEPQVEDLEPNKLITDQTVKTFNEIIQAEDTDRKREQIGSASLEGGTAQLLSTIETVVEEVEELIEGSIIDDEVEELIETTILDEEQFENIINNTEELNLDSVNELKELEKERERAQKIGIIEIFLLIVLIILVIIVVYLIIGV